MTLNDLVQQNEELSLKLYVVLTRALDAVKKRMEEKNLG